MSSPVRGLRYFTSGSPNFLSTCTQTQKSPVSVDGSSNLSIRGILQPNALFFVLKLSSDFQIALKSIIYVQSPAN